MIQALSDNALLLAVLAACVLVLLAITAWVLVPAFQGADAARRHLGTHRLALGSLIVLLVTNGLLTAPLALDLQRQGLTLSTFLPLALATQGPMLLLVYVRLIAPGAVTWSELGLRPIHLGRFVRIGVLAAIGGLVLTAALGLIFSELGLPLNQLDQFGFVRNGNVSDFLLVLLVGAAIGPFIEEIFFRGFLFGMYRRRKHPIMAYAASGLLFAALHANPSVMGVGPTLGLIAALFALATLLTWIYSRTGSLYPGMLAHGLNNAFAFSALYFLSPGSPLSP